MQVVPLRAVPLHGGIHFDEVPGPGQMRRLLVFYWTVARTSSVSDGKKLLVNHLVRHNAAPELSVAQPTGADHRHSVDR